MIESLMYSGLGFLAAALLVGPFGLLVVMPLVHGRAERLTTRRLEATIPQSMAEISADKDLLRAEFAVSTRRLEKKVEKLETSNASQIVEIAKKSDAISNLEVDLGAVRDQLRATEDELKAKTTAVREAEYGLSDKESELAKLRSALDERSGLVDLQKTELVAAGMQVEALKGRLAQMGEEVKAAEERRHGVERALSDKESEMARLTRAFAERSSLADSQKLEIMVLGTQVRALQERLTQAGEEAKALESLREGAERALSEKESKLATTMSVLDERSALADSQRGEIAALTMQIQTLQGRVTQSDEEVNAVESRRVAALRSLSEKESELARLTMALNESSVLVDSQKAEIAALVMQVQRLNEQLFQASEETRAVEDHRDGAMRALSEKESVLAELTTTLSERSALSDSRKAEVQKLNELLAQASEEVRTVGDQRDAAVRALSEKESEVARLATALNESSALVDSQKVENAALRMHGRALNERLIQAGKEAKAVEEYREAECRNFKAATQELVEERGKFENFHRRVTELVQQLTAQRTEDEALHRRAREDLENRLVVQSRLLNESEFELRQLRSEIESVRKAEDDLRVAIIEIDGRANDAAQNSIAEKARLEAALDRANGERARLVHELTGLKRRQGEETRAAEPVDSATLRKRVRNVAA
jgi:chromosome segregation ATPase